MKHLQTKLALIYTIHNRRILVQYNSRLYLEVTEKSLIDGLALNRNNIDISYFLVRSGYNETVVITKITMIAKDISNGTHEFVDDDTPWLPNYPIDLSA